MSYLCLNFPHRFEREIEFNQKLQNQIILGVKQMEAREQVSSKMSARGKGAAAAKFQLITTTWKSEPSAARFLIFQEMLFLLG